MKGSDNRRLIVWGERRKNPDWDKFLSALLEHSFSEVDRLDRERGRLADVLWQVAEWKDLARP